MDLDAAIKESQNIQSEAFVETLEKVTSLLQGENGRIGNVEITDHLVTLDPQGVALVIGDLHGDLESLSRILQESRFLQKMEKTINSTLIFLGDYGDRGEESAETYHLVLKLKLNFPKQVVLLRGNHEGSKDLEASPHDLPMRFQAKFADDWTQVYEKTRSLWGCLYNAVFVDSRFLLVHGGVSPEIRSLKDIAEAHEENNRALLEDLLWNDPVEGLQGVSPSPRGVGKLFGEDVTRQVLSRLNAHILIRGHEASGTGFKIDHEGKVLTLFSRKGAPYYNRYGAYLQVPLSPKFENAKQLAPFIHKF